MSTSRIKKLASIIDCKTADIESKLDSAGLPSPSFDPESSHDLLSRDDIAESRQSLLEATEELHALMLGPVGLLTCHSHEIFITLQVIYRFKLANSFPDGRNEATFEDIAQQSGLSVPLVRRFLRHAMTYHIFCEPCKGTVAHTAASRYLATIPLMHEWVGMVSEEMWPAATKTVEALVKWPNSEEPNHSGFNIAHDTKDFVFSELAKSPQRQARFAAAMSWFSSGPGLESAHIVNGFPWGTLPDQGTVVDIGGSHGSISIAIARAFPTLQFTVQDQAEVVRNGQARLPPELQPRVTFMDHDFFTEQPVKGADVYLLRWILHDWSDSYAIKILKSLIPALTTGSRICICEQVLPEPGTVSLHQAKVQRSMDLAMLEFHNAKERDRDDWGNLLGRADGRLRIVGIRQPKGSRLSMIEVRWLPDGVDGEVVDIDTARGR